MPTLLANPIFQREFRTNVRCRRTVVFALTLLGLLTLIIFAMWPRSGVFSESHSSELFTIFLGAELVMMVLFTPSFTATSITYERERNAFDLLFTSLLTPGEILSGKLAASLGMAFILLLISLPVTAVCALSGGISLRTLTSAYGVIALATLCYGLLGLMFSAICRRSYTSLVTTYIGILVLAGATWLPSVLLRDWLGFGRLFRALRALSPFEALFALRFAERYELSVSDMDAGTVLHIYFIGMLCLAAIFLFLFCLFVLRPPRRNQARTRQMYDDSRTAIKRKLGWPFYLIDPLRRKKSIGDRKNPVYIAELRSRIFGNPKFIIRALALCMSLSLLLLILIARQYGSQIDADKLRCVAIVFQLGVVALLAPAISSSSITDESTSGTLLMLRLTPLSATRVVIGKMKASLLYVMIFLVSSLPVLGALAYLESEAAYWRIGAWMAVLILTTVVFTAAGLFSSSVAPTTGAATAISYGFCILLCLGTLAILLLGSRISPEVQSLVLIWNPVVAALQVTSDTWFAGLPAVFGHKVWQSHMAAFIALALVLFGATAWRVHLLFARRD